jgi:phosphonate transport system ATP-binding protein
MAFIEVKGLKKEFAGFQALRGVNITVEKGEFISIIGPSGAGKSTFLRCINSTIVPSDGTVKVGNTLVNDLHGQKLFEHRARIGFIFQQFNLVKSLTVLKNVLVGRIVYNPRWRVMLGRWTDEDYEIAERFITEVGLRDKIHTRADNLSGGQQQRVAIARAMAQKPRLILADEPMASLDPKLSNVILGLLKKFNESEGITVIVNLHVLELARRYSTRIVALKAGEVAFDGKVDELSREALEQIYDIDKDLKLEELE